MSYIKTGDGTNLFYHDWGAGKPVVFSHGWILGADSWEYQTTYLAGQGLRCIPHDRRGCGRSDQPWDGYDMDTFADDLSALIEHLDLRDATLVAHSMGSGEVSRYLSRHGSGRVARVALIAPTTPFILKTPDNPEGLDASFVEAMMAGLSRDRPSTLAMAAPAFFGAGSSASAELISWGISLALKASPRATTEMFRGGAEADYRPDMAAFTVPTLIIHGDADQIAPLELTSRRTAEMIRGSRLGVYEGGGHGIFLTEKDRLNADLLAFINGETTARKGSAVASLPAR